MKVGDLVALLSQLPQDMEIFIGTWQGVYPLDADDLEDLFAVAKINKRVRNSATPPIRLTDYADATPLPDPVLIIQDGEYSAEKEMVTLDEFIAGEQPDQSDTTWYS